MPISANIYYTFSERHKPTQPIVVLLHGAGSTHLVWPARMRRLSGYEVLALDLPGHGKTGGIAQQTIDGYVQSIINFLDEISVYRVICIGHSMGGAIGLQMAKDYPERLRGLIMLSSGAYLGVPPHLTEMLGNPDSKFEALEFLEKYLFSEQTDRSLKKKMMKPLEDTRSGVLYNDWLACSRFDLRGKLDGLQTPVCIGNGADDRLTPPAYAHHLVSQVSGANERIFSGAGHMLILEKPQKVSTWVEECLKKFRG